MANLLSYLPPFEGLLPKWLFLVSVISAANSIGAYRSVDYAAQLYNAHAPDGRPTTNPLSSRTFGTWTFLSSVIRMYAAYHITTPALYDLALWSFGIAFVHFVAEWLVFGSAQLKGRFVSPLIVASSTLAWMVTQREAYLAM
ncbi:Erg28 family protein [Aspergillus clavatus NRRL 1]|uniref:Ergosterol biosynthesis protein Erg28, putative n=1 Tax=Aspergillus clavatus (strain ATCC 1007 / CBS 513.65 / DSM 816 / NCTC 3887 / NRRL 1 / QM 1276 / 107) TaxID=344612 RepID=A1C6J7_ASPCL|nr:ergosterol biosynthesis protein Erg28, putative [Aspergillus clavatus NRRL 1]EAW14018.1 ergosterol biosynthesis protein Erg28, putative [Aspergillus clavatus NRRL 1]